MNTKMTTQEKLSKLRAHLETLECDGFLLPRTDEYQSEYLAPYAERLSWLTGFTGSYAFAAILQDKANIVTDGRYALQIKQEVPPEHFAIGDVFENKVSDWIAENAAENSVIGYDPKLMTEKQLQQFEDAGIDKSIKFKALDRNPIDDIWDNQPSPPEKPTFLFSDKFAGRSSTEKRELIADEISRKNLSAFVITQPDVIAWLLNVRSDDIPHTPVALSYLVLHDNAHVDWYISEKRVSEDIRQKLGNSVSIRPPKLLESDLIALASNMDEKIGVDPERSPIWFQKVMEDGQAKVIKLKDPCIDIRACKIDAEQNAMRIAHKRDGRAVSAFIEWFKQEAPKGTLNELQVIDKLKEFREATGKLKDTSFETIAGWNANGAIIHYRADEKSNLSIKSPGILLLDSGGQYEDGTTDITRTLAIGAPSKEQIHKSTLVLKGHINLAMAVFPEGTTGAELDMIARKPLKDEGLNYAHGTGHGVGCYLSVHEEATSISPRSHNAVLEGMILSNEPGYYEEGEYGIRHESLVIVKDSGEKNSEGRRLFAFETITLVRFDESLIDRNLLTAEEIQWLDAYHQKCDENLED